ncbi:MAG: RHS repeat-associated core domain-containing protein [Verrucomicrobiota bacterium]
MPPTARSPARAARIPADNSVSHISYWPTGKEKATWGSQTNPVVKLYSPHGELIELRTFRSSNLALAPDENTAGYDATTWTYNNRGMLTQKTYADDKGPTYTYTPGGKLHTRTWARTVGGNPLVTTNGYNTAGELASTDYSDTTSDVSVVFDKLGRQVSVSNSYATSGFAYNPATLRQTSETISYDLNRDGTPELTRVLDRSQDVLGRDTGYSLHGSAGVPPAVEAQASYQYSATSGRLESVGNGTHNFAYGYVPNSNLISTITGPAHTVTNTYAADRDVLLAKENKVGTTTVSKYQYTVNSLGQRTALAQTGSAFPAATGWNWDYDILGQVTTAEHSSLPANHRAYQYDAIGNRIEARDGVTTVTGTTNYAANGVNQYIAVNSLSPAYDFDGNATSYPLPAAPAVSGTFAWDAENRKISNSDGNTVTIAFYDSQSRRVAETREGTTTLYVYDGWNCIAEYTGSTLSRIRTWGLDLPGPLQGAGGVNGLLAEKQGGNSFYPTYDSNGNVSEYLDSSGAVSSHFEYDPFGNTVVNTDSTNQFAYRFSTKPLNFATGFYYYGYRDYDPLTGRWPSRDPIEEEGGVNVYGFVNNDGVNLWDFLGMWIGPEKTEKGGKVIHPGRQSSESVTEVCAEEGDTWNSLAAKVGLEGAEASEWVTGYTDSPIPGKKYKVPNTIVAHWAGDVFAVGKAYVGWDGQIQYLEKLGFKVDKQDSAKGKHFALQNNLNSKSSAKSLHGLYFWGHGGLGPGNADGDQYPAVGLASNKNGGVIEILIDQPWFTNAAGTKYQDSGHPILSMKYKMAAGFVFACDSNSLKSALVSSSGIWHGYKGTLYPIFKFYGLKDHIKPGDQSTQK